MACLRGKKTQISPLRYPGFPVEPGAPHLARFSRDVGYHSAKPLILNLKQMSEGSGRVPHVRPSVRGPKTMGDPDFLPRGRHQRPRMRLSLRKAARSSPTPTRSTGNPGEAQQSLSRIHHRTLRALKAHTSTQRAHRALKAHTSTPSSCRAPCDFVRSLASVCRHRSPVH